MKVIKFIKKAVKWYCKMAVASNIAYPTGTVPTMV